MSIDVMTLVWRRAPYQGNTLLALLALADWSDDEGVSWPAVLTLAKKSRQSERNMQRVLHSLQRDGFLKIVERKNTSSKYTINLHRLSGCQIVIPVKSRKSSDKVSEIAGQDVTLYVNEPSLKAYSPEIRCFVLETVHTMLRQQKLRKEPIGLNAEAIAAHVSKEKQTVIPVEVVEEAIQIAMRAA